MIKVSNEKFPTLFYYMSEIRSLNILANNERLQLEKQKANAVNKSKNLSDLMHKLQLLVMPKISSEFTSGTAFIEFNNLATVQSGK